MTGPGGGIDDEPDRADDGRPDPDRESGGPTDRAPATAGLTRGRIIAAATIAVVALLTVGFLAGYAVSRVGDRGPDSRVSAPAAADSVDAGFTRDMIAHHNQGIVMAHNGELHSGDSEIQRMAYDINATQLAQVGQMQGWLALWQLPEQTTGERMSWMADGGHSMAGMGGGPAREASGSASSATGTAADTRHEALMPGMATSGEMDLLKSLRGRASDVYFLQLMIRHHVGGQSMMQFAADHAENPVVANFAFKMLEAQEGEVAVMTQMLAARGAEPLPYPPPS